ncbi:MAG TPA: methyl-accepting chemotaxis protein [Desulfuromonadales bacterium]|nr:methyl-accepting chemotaxis protein [Desulfuromonadales bacterium]
MKIKRFRNWGIQSKIMFISVFSAAIMLTIVFSYLMPLVEKRIIKEKEDATRHIVELAMGIVEVHDAEVKAGKLSLEQAQKEAAADVSRLRYEKTEYVWINDLLKPVPKMVMHPTVPALDGKVLDDPKFNKAINSRDGSSGAVQKVDRKNLFVTFNEVVERAGHGFVQYEWPKPKSGGGVTSELYPKLSYVKKFEPWGWVLGSGIYIDDVAKDVNSIKWVLISLNLLFAVFNLCLAYSIGRGITKPLKHVDMNLKEIARGGGDLTRRFTVERDDETGSLARSFNALLDNLKDTVARISASSFDVASAANQMNSTAARIAAGTEMVAMQSISVATAGEQMAATSADIAQNCTIAAENANRAAVTATNGADIVNHAVASIARIATKVKDVATVLETLSTSSEQIGHIVGTIGDIADQTNLLALNAAIEAARAGDQGRGFAVVADEVRALAERTTRATKEISRMITAIQKEMKSAVTAMEEGVREVGSGTEDATRSGQALQEILQQVRDVGSQIVQIAVAAEEQTATTDGISQNIHRITDVVQETSRSAKETAAAASQLVHMADELKHIVSQFRV